MINWKDYEVEAPAESVEVYGEGGLFPVYLGDKFRRGRYEVLNKLGVGGSSTVWAAEDHRTHTNVSLKIIRADESEDNRELRILQCIKENKLQHPGRKYLPTLLDHFYVRKSGRKNLILVLELLGATSHTVRQVNRVNPAWMRRWSKQLLLAVSCLHSYGIVHGDIHVDNVLFHLPENREIDLDTAYEGSVSRIDGAPLEAGIPSAVYQPLDFEDEYRKVELGEIGNLQLIDFSSAFFDSSPPKSIHTPEHMCPPELIFEKPLSKSVDIWNLGCTTFHFIFGRQLFHTPSDKLDLIPQFHQMFGESASTWLLNALIEALSNQIWGEAPEFDTWDDIDSLKESLKVWAKDDYGLTPSDVEDITSYLLKALFVDPTKRATVEELGAEDWVQSSDA